MNMTLKDFNELKPRDLENGATRDAIREVFRERDKLRRFLNMVFEIVIEYKTKKEGE